VKDGDSFDASRVAGGAEEIRIFGIDAPERSQPWSKRAREALAERVLGKTVRIEPVENDDYGRLVARVTADGACVGCELVRDGHAWVYRHYAKDPALIALEDEARAARRGLWALPPNERVPPWDWRRGRREAAALPLLAPPTEGFACDGKTYCREMRSCAEARFHLEQCGLARLDGDGDGVPCETLCSR
jgi:endonuclease YncB( thermonuclease family)